MRIRVGARTDVGNVREHNEDAYLAEMPLFAVADGMGGHQGGEVASRVALDTVESLQRKRPDGLDLAEAVQLANRAVLERASGDRKLEGMGTTLTLLRAEGDQVRLAHVGDSRAYLLRDGSLSQLTEDHTLVHRMVLEGKLTEQEAEIHPHRSILTRALGVEPNLQVDQVIQEIGVGDRVLLCSDGLTSMVDQATIERVLVDEADPQRASDRLVEAANSAGGQDNITAIVLDFVEGEPDPVAPAASAIAAAPARPRRWGRLAVRVAAVALLLLAAFLAARTWVFSQWFVGVDDGSVALYRGIPSEVLGYELSTVVERTDVDADAAADAARDWERLEEGIPAESEEDARDIIEQIRRDVDEAADDERRATGDGEAGS